MEMCPIASVFATSSGSSLPNLSHADVNTAEVFQA